MGGVAAWLFARARRRSRWDSDLATARSEGQWVLSELVPVASSRTSEQWQGAWTLARPRVLALETQLSGLVANSPDDVRTSSAGGLLAAVRSTATAMEQVADRSDDESRAALDSAAQHLTSVINPPPEAAPDGTSGTSSA